MPPTHTLLAIDFQSGLSDTFTSIAKFIPKLVAFLVILLIGWIIAKIVAKAVRMLLEKAGFDRLVERGGIKAALDRSPYDASGLIAKLIYYAVLLITLMLAFSVFGPNPISQLLTDLVAWLPQLLVAIIIIVVVAAIASAVRTFVASALGALSYGPMVAKAAAVAILALGVIAALNQIGFAVTVTTPVLITILATIGGIAVVGLGGGLVRPMQSRWERWLSGAEAESGRLRTGRPTGATGAGGAPGGAGAPPGEGPGPVVP